MGRLGWLLPVVAVAVLVWWLAGDDGSERRTRDPRPADAAMPRTASAPTTAAENPGARDTSGGVERPDNHNGPMILRVLAPDGRAAEHVAINPPLRAMPIMTGPPEVKRRADGTWFIRDRKPVSVYARGLGTLNIRFTPGPRTVRFAKPAVVTFTFTPYTLKRDGLAAFDTASRLSAFGRRGAPVAPDGTVRFGPMQPGARTLILFSEGGVEFEDGGTMHSSAWVVLRRRFDIASGEHTIEVPAPALHRATVQFERVQPGATASIEPAGREVDQRPQTTQVGADGRATFRLLASGSYWVFVPGLGRMRMAVPAPRSTLFRPGFFYGLRVVVAGPASPWAKLGLETGDVIVGYNGVRIEATTDVKRLRPPDRFKEKILLRLRARNGAENELEVRHWLLFGERVHANGYLEPEPVGER